MRHSLRLVLESRDYAAKLGLEAKETYTTYADVGRDTLLLVLQAAPKDCICPYTWKYPIVGRIPYKGFFDFEAARRANDQLAARGYDVYLRTSSAFSTLGWFNDPLLSTAITRDSVELAATVFHEIAHNTLYVKSATPVQRELRQFVGYRSAQSFFASRADTANARQAADRLARRNGARRVLRRADRAAAIRSTPASPIPPRWKPVEPRPAPGRGRSSRVRWGRGSGRFKMGRLPERPVNNARLIGATLYRTRLDLFDSGSTGTGTT